MDNKTPQHRENDLSPERPISNEVFYATGMSIDVNPNELLITFERNLPYVEPKSTSIVLAPGAIYQLQQGINTLAETHTKSMENIEKNGYYGEPPSN